MQVNGAVFADAGNIWYLKKTTGRTAEEIFSLRRLGQDLAVGVGTGLRLDFTYFVIRQKRTMLSMRSVPVRWN